MELRRIWRDLSVSTKLYVVVGIMGMLIATELFTLRFAMMTLSSVRAFVGGEGLWSKAQKTSIIALRRYTESHDEKDYQAFLLALEVPLGDHMARLNLIKAEPDIPQVFVGFERGHIHHDDIQGLIELVRRFYWVPHLNKALGVWAEADDLIFVLERDAESLHELVSHHRSATQIEARMHGIEQLNDAFTKIEDQFSYVLGEGSRWLENLVMRALILLVLTVEGTGLFLTISFSRTLSKTLIELCEAAGRIGRGVFSGKVVVRSRDELGLLAESLNSMTVRLEETIGSRRQAEQANETKSAFLANMSHEIRTPMGAILGFADVLKDPDLSVEERVQYVGIIERNGKALIRVIDDILDLSKVEAGGLVIENLEFSLPALIEDVAGLYLATASAKGVALDVRIEPSARRAVSSDPTRLRQILNNIIGNAVKFTSIGHVVITARTLVRNQAEIVQISVKDSGIGLTAEQSTKLFEPFTQADNSTTRKFGGTGLGLALSKRLAQALGGDVFISDSGVGRGSTFMIEVVSRHSGQHLDYRSRQNGTGTPKARISKSDLAGRYVLVVEDSKDIQALLKVMLTRHGVRVDFASDGAEGVELALHHPYDMVFMDIQMPGMDGYQAIAALREKKYSRPVVALTAHAMKEERDRSLASGFSDHLTKPVDEASLTATIRHFTTPHQSANAESITLP